MPAKFVLKKGTTGKFRFSLVSASGRVVATSEAYETKRAALAGIASVQKIAAGAAVEDMTAPAPKASAAKPAAKAAAKPVAKAAAKPAAKAPARRAASRKPAGS